MRGLVSLTNHQVGTSCRCLRSNPVRLSTRRLQARTGSVRCESGPNGTQQESSRKAQISTDKGVVGLGDLLGPIGLTVGESHKTRTDVGEEKKGVVKSVADAANVSLGPISLTFSDDFRQRSDEDASSRGAEDDDIPDLQRPRSISSMTTSEWRETYEKDGYVDLWVEEEFNSGSRLVGGRTVHNGGIYGWRSGEGPSAGGVPSHKVKIFNHYADQVIEVDVPEDRYILWEAEDRGLELPYACRMGCCTACAVRVKEGEMYQPQALGISEELKAQGYALMCVAFPLTDCVLETVEEDEVYDLQFGRYFEELATDPNAPSIERDDFALEFANMDE